MHGIIFVFYIFVCLQMCRGADYFIGTVKDKIKNINIISEANKKCLADLNKYIEDLEGQKSWAVYMNDAGASFIKQEELLKGTWSNYHLADLGHGYTTCLDTKQGNITGAYCIINLFLEKFINKLDPEVQRSHRVKDLRMFIHICKKPAKAPIFHGSIPIRLRLAACVPASCTPDILNDLNLLPDTNTVAHCHTKVQLEEYRQINNLDICFIIFLSTILLLMVVGTYQDIRGVSSRSGCASEVLAAFSVATNGRELLSPSKSTNFVGCLDGLRTISVLTVVMLHMNYVYLYLPISNFKMLFNITGQSIGTSISQLIMMSVDTFFFMGGFVMAYNFLKRHGPTGGASFNLIRHYIQRYCRLTPVIAVVIFYHSTLYRSMQVLGETPGPLWHKDQAGDGILHHLTEKCWTNFWYLLLHVQNLFGLEVICLEQLWYVAVDYQLTLIAPLFLMFMARKTTKKRTKIIVLSCVTIFVTFVAFLKYFTNAYNAVIFKNIYHATFISNYYISTVAKCSPWFVGLIYGYILYNAPNNTNLNKWLGNKSNRSLLWILSLLIFSYCLMGHLLLPDLDMDFPTNSAKFQHSFFATVYKVMWAVMLGTMVYTIHVIIPNCTLSKLLSHPICQFVAKIQYSVYVSHLSILSMKAMYLMNATEFHLPTLFVEMYGTLVPVFILGTFLTLSIEMPFMKLYRIFFPEGISKVSILNGQNGNCVHKENGSNGTIDINKNKCN